MKVDLNKNDMEAIAFLLASRLSKLKYSDLSKASIELTSNELNLMKKLKFKISMIDDKLGIISD